MSVNSQLIRNATLLNTLPHDAIRAYLKRGDFRVVRYEKNNVLHLEGEECTRLELILSGEIVVEHISESGDLLTVAEFIGGDTLGGNILFSANPYYPLTVATRSAAVVMEIHREVVFKLCSQRPVFLQGFLQHVSDHAFILGDKIKYYAKKSIRERVLGYLHQEQQRQCTNLIQLNMTKKELAEKIGVQRTSLSRELAKMRDDGLILFDRDSITLL
ncbi:MAG TPA: Crp/Fnr family transcriptional regulator [Firmicutes bacterium]|jgi:CRP-like cAMP-binding protein|nr:Crp/Fnr family transcriptional regulator [Bacillota bacterium]